MEAEICICAAVKTEDGEIIRGHRHRDCYHNIARRNKKPAQEYDAQGFITSRNRFVGREEGLFLQVQAGKASANPEGYTPGLLFSEDLY